MVAHRKPKRSKRPASTHRASLLVKFAGASPEKLQETLEAVKDSGLPEELEATGSVNLKKLEALSHKIGDLLECKCHSCQERRRKK